jgi:hypothetical protein
VTTHSYNFTLSKFAAFYCLALASYLIYKGQYTESATWGMYGMAIFSVKNVSTMIKG